MKERECGIDIFRIMCCIGVLDYHIMDDVVFSTGGDLCRFLYFMGSFCVPGFFLLAGYLVGARENISMSYIENKMISIIRKCFGWVVFWISVHYLRTGEMYELWDHFTAAIEARGILPVAWFLFLYCLLLLLGYPLYHFYKKYPYVFSGMVVLWLLALSFGYGLHIRETRGQHLWIHLYLGYFCAGMALNRLKEKMSRGGENYFIILAGINLCSLCVYGYKVRMAEEFLLPHTYYGSWFYITWLVSLFLFVSMIDFQNECLRRIISGMALNTFVVYLGHLPILLYVTGIYPLRNTAKAVVYILIFFVGLQLAAEVFRRFPVLRKLT